MGMLDNPARIEKWELEHYQSGECSEDAECACAARCAFCGVEHVPPDHDRTYWLCWGDDCERCRAADQVEKLLYEVSSAIRMVQGNPPSAELSEAVLTALQVGLGERLSADDGMLYLFDSLSNVQHTGPVMKLIASRG